MKNREYIEQVRIVLYDLAVEFLIEFWAAVAFGKLGLTLGLKPSTFVMSQHI